MPNDDKKNKPDISVTPASAEASRGVVFREPDIRMQVPMNPKPDMVITPATSEASRGVTFHEQDIHMDVPREPGIASAQPTLKFLVTPQGMTQVREPDLRYEVTPQGMREIRQPGIASVRPTMRKLF